jgi:hypothetical protein
MYEINEEELWTKSKLLDEMKRNAGLCAECGKPFEQGFRINQKTGEKIFNQFKYCPKCRIKITKDKEVKTTNVSIKYDPYPWQKKFHASKARFKVVSGAARTGKDFSFDKEFTMKFVEMLNEKRSYTLVPRVHGWVVGPTYKLLAQIERNFMNDFPRELVVNYDKENHVIDTVNGGLIEFRSADDPDSLVSVGLDIVYITEAARIKQFDIVIGNITDRLDSPGRGPNGTGGLGLINSSPRGRTFFNEVCKWGIDGGSKQRPGWETWYVSRWENPTFADRRYKVFDDRIGKWVERGDDPYLANKRTYEEDLMLSRSDRQYREDILGIPSDDAGSQFPNFRENAEIEKPNLPKDQLKEYIKKVQTPKPYFTYSIGFDPAKEIDGAWLCVYCENTGEVVEYVRLQNIPYTVQINVYIKELVKKWNYAMVRYGKTGLGEALEDIFKLAGIAYIAYPEQGKNKEKLVENLTALVKSGKFKIHNINDTAETAIRQFEDYGFDISEKGKTITYSNMTSGGHDDAVSSSYFAVADINIGSIEEMANFYSDNNFMLLNNAYNKNESSKGSFF